MARIPMQKFAGSALAAATAEQRGRRTAMAEVAARFKGFRPALEVLTPVRAVRTIFPSINLATRVGGWPSERVSLIHGMSNHGKSELAIGLGQSFLLGNHFFNLVDAEQTTPEDWVRQLMGECALHPGFTALRPRTYEQTTDAVRQWAETIGDARAKGEIPSDTTGICVIDSIRKLVPANLLKTIMKEVAEDDGERSKGPRRKPKRGIDGMGGRAGQYKAALNSAWMDEAIPLMAQTGTALAIIAREIEDADADPFSGIDYKIGGGKAINYDSSLRVRVVLEKQIWQGEGSDRRTLGERHRIEIHKTKIGKKEERVPSAYFHTSNGALVREGFDTARDLLEVGQELGIVELRGSNYYFDGEKLAQGEHNAVVKLYEKPDRLAALDDAVAKQIDEVRQRESERRRAAVE